MLRAKFYLFMLHSLREERKFSRIPRRFLYTPCEPPHIAWQWQVKKSPDIVKCSPSCLVKKECPPKRFIPRFKKHYIYKDLTSCKEEDMPRMKKAKTWKDYIMSFLPFESKPRPKLKCCRKLMEMRRKQCSSLDNWKDCVSACCWPAPIEWMGQGVLHEFSSTLPKPVKFPVPQPCPPPQHMIPRCVMAKMVACPIPKKKPLCLEDYKYEPPFANFKGATPQPQPQYIIKCPFPCTDLPEASEKSIRLSCKTYGEFKGVECPKQMFTRFLSVNVAPDGRLLPATVSGHSAQSEMPKASCKFHTFAGLNSSHDSTRNSTEHLQPNRSAMNVDRLTERIGFQWGREPEVIKKNLKMPKSPIFNSKLSVEERIEVEVEKAERELELTAEEKEARERKLEQMTKSPLQLLAKKQQAKKGGHDSKPSVAPRPLYGDRPVDLEDTPFMSQTRRKFHTSVSDWAKKRGKKGDGKGMKKVNVEPPICGGCPGIKAADNPDPAYVKGSFKAKCRRRAAGQCKGKKKYVDPKDPPPMNTYQKCREKIYSPCLMPSVPTLELRAPYSTSDCSDGSKEESCCEKVKKLEKELECCKKLAKLKEEVEACKQSMDNHAQAGGKGEEHKSKEHHEEHDESSSPKKAPRIDEVHHIERESCPAMKMLKKQQLQKQQKQQKEAQSSECSEKEARVCPSPEEKLQIVCDECIEKCSAEVEKELAKRKKKVENAAKRRKLFEECVEEKLKKACKEKGEGELSPDCLDDIKYECEKNMKFMNKVKKMFQKKDNDDC